MFVLNILDVSDRMCNHKFHLQLHMRLHIFFFMKKKNNG